MLRILFSFFFFCFFVCLTSSYRVFLFVLVFSSWLWDCSRLLFFCTVVGAFVILSFGALVVPSSGAFVIPSFGAFVFFLMFVGVYCSGALASKCEVLLMVV